MHGTVCNYTPSVVSASSSLISGLLARLITTDTMIWVSNPINLIKKKKKKGGGNLPGEVNFEFFFLFFIWCIRVFPSIIMTPHLSKLINTFKYNWKRIQNSSCFLYYFLNVSSTVYLRNRWPILNMRALLTKEDQQAFWKAKSHPYSWHLCEEGEPCLFLIDYYRFIFVREVRNIQCAYTQKLTISGNMWCTFFQWIKDTIFILTVIAQA